MRVLFDHQIFEMQQFGGISRYFTELFKSFEVDQKINWTLALEYTNNEYLNEWGHTKNKFSKKPKPYDEFLNGLNFRGKWKLFELKNKIFHSEKNIGINHRTTKKYLTSNNYDLFHPTYYDDYFLDLISKKPFVVTAHDLIYEKFSAKYPIKDPYIKSKENLLKMASRIIAVSENTKKNLVEHYKIEPNKIEVIYLASSLNLGANNKKPQTVELPEKYFLFVGNRSYYKNFTFFIEIAAKFLYEDKNLSVVCTGKAFEKDEIILLNNLGIADRVKQLFANDEELSYLYTNALAFIFPSLYEGFGIPVLEAFSCDCPVLLSNQSSLPEVGGDAAIYFNPTDQLSLHQALEKVIGDGNVREELKLKGRERLKDFSWEKTAIKTVDLYKSVLAQG